MFTRVLFFFISILSTTTFAQTWQQTQMYGGGYVTGIIPHPTDENISYARIDVSGVYKTSNGGDNWESITKDIIKDNHYNYYVRSFAIDETNTDKLYFLSGNAPYDNGSVSNEWFLWTSTNGGIDWNRVVSPTAIGGNGYARSAGETLAISPNDADVLYIAGQPTYNYGTGAWNTNGGLHIYNVNTGSWSIPTGINGTFDQAWITKVHFAPNDSDVLYISAVDNTLNGVVSSNSGLWKYVISTGTLTQLRVDEVHDFDFDATNSSIILTTQNAGIDKSTDGGQTWEGLTQPFGYTYNFCVTAHPTESGHWFLY